MKKIVFGRHLTSVLFEKKMRGASLNSKNSKGWAEKLLSDGLLIDLSKVEFAEFSTLAQIAILIEGAARHGIKVNIALPLVRERKGEEEFINRNPLQNSLIDNVRKRVIRRKKALRFMKVSGFIDAIKVEHVPNANNLIFIDYDYDEKQQSELDNESNEENKIDKEDKFEYLLQQIFPMQWFEPQNGEDLAKSQRFATAVLGLHKIGLNKEDAKVLAGTLLDELVENVYYYSDDSKSRSVSCRPFALVGAIILDNGYQFKDENYHAFLSEFIKENNTQESNVVRIVVGDSGLGIPEVLGKYFVNKEDEIPRFINNDTTLNDKILLWSLNRWSTSNLEYARIKRGTRGLWRINRLIRSYHGFLTLRSADSLISYLHGIDGSFPQKSDKRPKYLQGTFVDICILPNLQKESNSFASLDANLNNPNFEVLHFESDPVTCIPKGVQTELIEKLAKHSSKCIILAINNIPLETSKQTQLFFLNLFNICSDFANPSAIAIVLLNCSWRQIESSFESAEFFRKSLLKSNNKQNNSTKIEEDPIFIIDLLGNGRWVKTEEPISLLLNRLNDSQLYTLSFDDLPSSLDFPRLKRLLKDQPDIIEIKENEIRLRFSTIDIINQIISFIGKRLKNLIDNPDNKNVIAGAFRTPTLENVSRWVDVKGLIDFHKLNSIVSFAIAGKLKTHLNKIPSKEYTLARIDNTPYKITSSIIKCLQIENKIVSFNGGLGILENSEIKAVSPDQKVIIVCDIIMTANTLKHILSKLVRWDISNIVIICIFDARKKEEINEIECMGQTFNVLSLANIDTSLGVKENSHILSIDPILRKPVLDSTYQEINNVVPSEEFLNWCNNNEESVYIGHIEGATGKHFLSYINGEKTLLEKSLIKEKAIEAFSKSIKAFFLDSSNIEIWYPTPDKYAKLIAEIIAENFSAERKIYIRKIPRSPLGGKWLFPSEIEKLRKETDILIVDWGALTSSTIQQLTRLAVLSGAQNILGFILISQMHSDEQMVISRIERFYREEEVFENLTETLVQQNLFESTEKLKSSSFINREIPFKIVFLTHLNLVFYMPNDCPLCDLQKKFQVDLENCQLKIFKDYAKKRFDLLKTLDKENIFTQKHNNIYGEYLTNIERVEILKIWQQLNVAVRSTEKRFEILVQLNKLAESTNEEDISVMVNWVRAVTNDPNWLKLHPLRFELLRDRLADISIKIIKNSHNQPDEIIQQALIVLRVTSTYKFIKFLPEFFSRFIDNYSIIQQILYDIHTFLGKDTFELNNILGMVYKNLQACRDTIFQKDENKSFELEYRFEVMTTLNSLIRTVDFRYEQRITAEDSITDVWSKLIEKYQNPMKSHDEVINDMQTVYFYINQFEFPELDAPKADILTAIEKWRNCQSFLSKRVFPYLYHLKSIFLEGYYNNNLFDDKDVLKLEEIFSLNESMSESTEKLFNMLIDLYNMSEEKQYEFARVCMDEIAWWNDFFLEPGTPKDPILQSTFLQILDRCPCNLKAVLKKSIDEMEHGNNLFNHENLDKLDDNLKVFCDKELLKSIFNHIIENACSNLDWSQEILFEWDIKEEKKDHITFYARNNNTENREINRGNGIGILNKKLESFKGNLIGEKPDNINPWTFEVKLELLKWS